jgi:hypothetical protein
LVFCIAGKGHQPLNNYLLRLVLLLLIFVARYSYSKGYIYSSGLD